MTFAIIETGGKQYKVQTGDQIKVEKLEAKQGEKISLATILVDDGKTTKTGKAVAEIKTAAEMVGGGRAKKISVIHYKSKVRHYKKRGHRQLFSEIKIGEIK